MLEIKYIIVLAVVNRRFLMTVKIKKVGLVKISTFPDNNNFFINKNLIKIGIPIQFRMVNIKLKHMLKCYMHAKKHNTST